MKKKRKNLKEEYGIVLDFLSHGKSSEKRSGDRRSVAQVLGEKYLTLLKVATKKGVFLEPEDKVYLGEGKREKVHHIVKKLDYSDLTPTAETEIKEIVKNMVEEKEDFFVDFLNNAGALSTRLHKLELLPGIGKKHMWSIIEGRKGEKFESFDDVSERVDLFPNPKKTFVKRILKELKGEDKHNLFVRKGIGKESSDED